MKTIKTVLVTSAGVATAVNVISALRRSEHFEYRIVAVDMDPHAAGLHLADQFYLVPRISDPGYLEQIVDIVRSHAVSFVFPLYSREVALFAASHNHLSAAGASLLIPDPAVVALCDEKLRFLDFLREHNFAFPETFASSAAVTGFPVFMKPVSGSSSAHTFVIRDEEDLAFYAAKYPSSIIQRFIDAPEYTVDCLVDPEGCLIAAVPRQRLRVKDGKSVVGKTVKNPLIEEEVKRLLAALRITGPCNVQLFFDGKKVRFVEVNPRLAAGGLPLAVEAGVNIPELMIRIADGERPGYQDFSAGVIMIRYLSDVFVREDAP